jgi:hypothetical protein
MLEVDRGEGESRGRKRRRKGRRRRRRQSTWPQVDEVVVAATVAETDALLFRV